jgi:hypothetical protein
VVQERAARIALEALVPENLHLSQEMVQQIVRETHPDRALSQFEIQRLASSLNQALWDYERRKQLLSEPTAQQLRKQIGALHKALRQLKLALPAPEQNSLRNYLIHLGVAYAEPRGGHPNLAPHSVGGLLETGEEVSAIDHYRSDERLDEMISSVSQVLEWMNKTPASTKKISYWWDRTPHWLDDQTLWERLEHGFNPEDVERHKLTERLIGRDLPRIYHLNFGKQFGVSRTASGKYGPGVRFVVSVLRYAGMNVLPETVIRYRTKAKGKSKKH